MTTDHCVFCSVLAGRIPSEKLYEQEQITAFLDIAPISKGHTLVIPDRHISHFDELTETELVGLSKAVALLAPRITRAVGADGYNLGVNNGRAAGQIITHVHWHIIPRFEADGLKSWPNRKTLSGELQQIAESIRKELQP
ncbi:MAG: hypothetical protein A3B30_03280 [Candidatus Komeilibacteria bacterium RIFCSPLOWO2_01_FULL_52_15]|uniref:HIT domain-containing protein n=1 Tax=Candidatus Komeilibacteria bacterium RIFCSPLOWO2_01_FULL_52_15 TaxID=1798551 RepID=A0A1G2BQC7_9BACT|nr:MAG: hypothetical protein A3B30_03280 [Candidatus Komeilibacteria bacterium RIFCSPLOWO2_01_FULL_52_15]